MPKGSLRPRRISTARSTWAKVPFPRALHADGRNEVFDQEHIISKRLINEGTIVKGSKLAVRACITQAYDVLLAHQRLSACFFMPATPALIRKFRTVAFSTSCSTSSHSLTTISGCPWSAGSASEGPQCPPDRSQCPKPSCRTPWSGTCQPPEAAHPAHPPPRHRQSSHGA